MKFVHNSQGSEGFLRQRHPGAPIRGWYVLSSCSFHLCFDGFAVVKSREHYYYQHIIIIQMGREKIEQEGKTQFPFLFNIPIRLS